MNHVLIGLPDLAKGRKLSKIVIRLKITKYLRFSICFCQRETFYIFYTFDKIEIDF